MAARLSNERLLAIIEVQNEILGAALEPQSAMALLARRAQALTGAAGAVIERASGDELAYHVGSGAGEMCTWISGRSGPTLTGLCLHEGEPLYCPDCEDDARVDRELMRRLGIRSMLCVALIAKDTRAGVLTVFAREPEAFDRQDAMTLSILAKPAAAQMVNARRFQRAREESRQDGLTGLPNRRAFEERLGAEVARVRRHGGELALGLFDLDGFRTINDSLGRAVGDEVLRGVAAHLAQVRGEDAAFRLGGDRFAIIFVETDLEGAMIAARRLEAAVLGDHGCGGAGVSCGVAALRGGDPAGLVNEADAELYRVKRLRNSL